MAPGPRRPWLGLSWMPGETFRAAAFPLLAAGDVDTLEWSFDLGWDRREDAAQTALLDHYAAAGRLLGHGVGLSVLSGNDWPRQAAWLDRARTESASRHYRRVSEHFGFMTGGAFHRGPPLPPPLTPGSLAVGRDRLLRLAEATRVPVGLENLAFAFSVDDVAAQGEFLDRLLEPVDGYLLLDLHNLWCQSVNFDVPVQDLLHTQPLERVRELHVSGGSWSTTSAGTVRRDTHDDGVPDEVFELLALALGACPDVEAVILERLPDGLDELGAITELHSDFRRLRDLATRMRPSAPDWPPSAPGNPPAPAVEPVLDVALGDAQGALLAALFASTRAASIRAALKSDPRVATWLPDIDRIDPRMLETAASLTKRWGHRQAV